MLLELLRKKSTVERIRFAANLTACVRHLVKRSLRERYPAADEKLRSDCCNPPHRQECPCHISDLPSHVAQTFQSVRSFSAGMH